ncbi:phosphoribosylanthranilate isomerase [Muriicola soli]|uniref:N-(5'-phosphoribosyl)anthranilate isomerase n=1 Tax=Muriicola soli TaxID=2507538 RepID=A0A411E7N6_9FLAO|nr:phosphoribosylanthranilate isomerase [Muriicola soli]QBA63533.1 phosphoribosylanthranilate isomerase [Muriicola soli]
MKIKVCGMKYPENITAVARLQPDYMGFILWEKSPRYFRGSRAALPESLEKVGVFVDASLEEIIEKTEALSLDLVQLHGSESPEFCSRLLEALKIVERQRHKVDAKIKIIKAIGVGKAFPFEDLRGYEDVVDYFLFDTKGPLPGGNGYSFNWELLNSYTLKTPFFLSGGIGLKDTEKLKAFLKSPLASQCHAIDVNSAFESEPGEKKSKELDTFIKQLKL